MIRLIIIIKASKIFQQIHWTEKYEKKMLRKCWVFIQKLSFYSKKNKVQDKVLYKTNVRLINDSFEWLSYQIHSKVNLTMLN